MATFSVTNLMDGPVTAAGDLPGSLRQAVFDANNTAGADTIDMSAVNGTLLMTDDEFELTEAVTIDGPGQNVLTIDAQQNSRIFNIIAPEGNFAIAGLTLTNGQATVDAAGRGGAIQSSTTGNLTISDSTVSGSSAFGYLAGGGGIFASGDLTITQSTVSGNDTTIAGGGGIASFGTIMLYDSDVTGNSTQNAYAYGGGVFASGNVTLTGSTVTGNTTTGSRAHGGGIFSSGNVTLTDSLVGGNGTTGFSADGGGIRAYGDVTLIESIVTANGTGNENADGGGIYSRGNVTLTDSTVSGNSTVGQDAEGGGIHSRNDVMLTESNVSGNFTLGVRADGGGVFAGGVVTLLDSSVIGNVTFGLDASGGGINSYGDVSLTASIVSGNRTTGNDSKGGGVYAYGTVVLNQSTVSGNSTEGDNARGGGIYSEANVTLTESTVRGNSTSGYDAEGGGIRAFGSVTLAESTVSGNRTTGESAEGGGVIAFDYVSVSQSTVSGNLIEGDSFGGAGVVAVSGITLTRSTITNNHSIHSNATAGGIWVFSGPMTITNSIVAGNTAGGGMNDILPGSVTQTVNFSLIEETAGLNIVGGGNITGLPANLGPLADNGGLTKTHALLPTGNPATDPIDNGDPSIVFDPLEFDQRGAPFVRVADGDGVGDARIDMGATERQVVPGLNLVVDTIVDQNNGDYSASDLSLREAIGLANGSLGADTVTFDPVVFATPQTIALELGEIELTEAATIDGPGQDLLTIDAQQQSRIFNIIAQEGDFTIAGLTLSGGRTTGDSEPGNFEELHSGGAVRSLTNGDLAIEQSTVMGNSTAGFRAEGGGVFARGNVMVTDSTLTGNSTAGDFSDGGAVLSLANVTISRSTFSGNSTAGNITVGGAILAEGDVSVTGSTISGNNAIFLGGGVRAGGHITLVHSTVSGNNSSGDGGGISTLGAVTVSYSTITDNHADDTGSTGGGIHTFNGPIEIANSIVAENTAGAGRPDIDPGSGSLDVDYSLIGHNDGTDLMGTVDNVPDEDGNLIGGLPGGNLTGLLQVSIDLAAMGEFDSGNDSFQFDYSLDGSGFQPLFSFVVQSGNQQQYTLESGANVFLLNPLRVPGNPLLNNSFQTFSTVILGSGGASTLNVRLRAHATETNEAFAFRNLIVTDSNSGELVGRVITSDSDVNVTFQQNDPDYTVNGSMFGIRSRTNPGIPGLPDSIVDQSLASPPDMQGIIRSNDLEDFFGVVHTNNGIGDSMNQAFWTFNLQGDPIDPQLGPLANNGGPTQTHALLAESPAIDAGDMGFTSPPDYDQRGFAFSRVVGGRIDMGAVERGSVSADFDLDGAVSGLDFLRWQRGAGTTGTAVHGDGDANIDTDVDSVDLDIWEDQYGTTPASQVAAAAAPVELASAAVSTESLQQTQPAVDGLQPLSADLVDAAIVVGRAQRSDSGSHLGPPRFLGEGYFDWLSRSTERFQHPTWQGPSEIADHSFRDQTHKVNHGRFHREACDDAVDEDLLDELFAEVELGSLL